MFSNIFRNIYYRLPEEFQRAVLVRRRQAEWVRAGLVFIHIPKVAGTAFNEALYGRFMGHVHASDIERWGSAELKALPAFAVTRNPWDRLVSAYRFAKRGAGLGGPHAGRVRRAKQYRRPEFDTFETFVTKWLAPRDLRNLDVVFQPQSPFVCDDGGNIIVSHLGRFENLGPTFSFVRKFVPNLPELEKSNLSGESVDYRTFYNRSLIDLVGSIYEEDVRRFNYTFE
jgi:chondroitin 4-sulfotransferase 11